MNSYTYKGSYPWVKYLICLWGTFQIHFQRILTDQLRFILASPISVLRAEPNIDQTLLTHNCWSIYRKTNPYLYKRAKKKTKLFWMVFFFLSSTEIAGTNNFVENSKCSSHWTYTQDIFDVWIVFFSLYKLFRENGVNKKFCKKFQMFLLVRPIDWVIFSQIYSIRGD